jgi:hypothetical protein
MEIKITRRRKITEIYHDDFYFNEFSISSKCDEENIYVL